ncbi:hypothetical protein MMC17_005231 [Xylographa soralifera]|nr:hypothetical protein [Xylographa soralifera]
MHLSTATIFALLSASSLATAGHVNIQRRHARPMDIYARAAYPEDLHARDAYDSDLYARDAYPEDLYARDPSNSHLHARDTYHNSLSRRDELSSAKADVLANFKAVLASPGDAGTAKFNANAEKQVALAKKYTAQAQKAGTSPQRKKMLLEAVKVLESDDPPPGITMAQLKAAGFDPTTENPNAH